MTRQLKISEDVHFMLTLLKPFDSTSYDEVIRDLIENACPYLPRRLERLAKYEQDDPGLYYSELDELKQELFELYYVEGLVRRREEQKEREKEEQLDSYLEELESEREAEIEGYAEDHARLQEPPQKLDTKKVRGIPKKRSEKK